MTAESFRVISKMFYLFTTIQAKIIRSTSDVNTFTQQEFLD
jgi:hypothetical protein